MNAAPLAAASPRRAALLVHAMPPADREWLLGSLAPHHRVELELLLDELRELGIPRDEAMLREIVAAPPQARPATAVERMETITPAQVARLAHLLRQEPPQLAATLLALRAWPWKDTVARALAPLVKPARPLRAPALQHALCESVLRRLAAAETLAPPPARPWQRLLALRWQGRRA